MRTILTTMRLSNCSYAPKRSNRKFKWMMRWTSTYTKKMNNRLTKRFAMSCCSDVRASQRGQCWISEEKRSAGIAAIHSPHFRLNADLKVRSINIEYMKQPKRLSMKSPKWYLIIPSPVGWYLTSKANTFALHITIRKPSNNKGVLMTTNNFSKDLTLSGTCTSNGTI